jgi:methionyl-tRNA formyltransferase
MKIIFFGSTTDSVLVLNKISQLGLEAIVTQPAKPTGRNHEIVKTPVQIWAESNQIPCFSFPSKIDQPWLYADVGKVIDALLPINADLIISACYGQKIPDKLIRSARLGGLNVHPSLLPRWRGADPVPWTIIAGDTFTGVTVVTISETFDAGEIIAQQKIPITVQDFPDPLRTKLFEIGAELLINCLHNGIASPPKVDRNDIVSTYARKFTRDDGFVPWELINDNSTIEQFNNLPIMQTLIKQNIIIPQDLPTAVFIDRIFRALSPWPGIWTNINGKRCKILKIHLENMSLIIDQIQLEGKKPVSFKQFKEAYIHI